MAPIKRQRSIKKARTSSQAPSWPQRTSRTSTTAWARGNNSHHLGLTSPERVARYSFLNERIVVATRYYDEELLGWLGLLDDIRWLFVGGMRHFIEIKEYIYRDLTLEFLSTLYVESPEGLNVKQGTFSFICKCNFMSWSWVPSIVHLVFHLAWIYQTIKSLRIQPKCLLGQLSESIRCRTSSSKCIHIRNAYIRVA